MTETQENQIAHQNGQRLHLKYHFQLKDKRACCNSSFGLQKGGRQFTGDRKQIFGKQIYAGSCRDNDL